MSGRGFVDYSENGGQTPPTTTGHTRVSIELNKFLFTSMRVIAELLGEYTIV